MTNFSGCIRKNNIFVRAFVRERREDREGMDSASLNMLSHDLIEAAIEVHLELGPGLLESAYEAAYAVELTLRGIPHVRQESLPIVFKGIPIISGYRVGFLADNRVIVEVKAVERLIPLFSAQLLTYLRLGGYPLGLLVNFNVPKLEDGIECISNHTLNPIPTPAEPGHSPLIIRQ